MGEKILYVNPIKRVSKRSRIKKRKNPATANKVTTVKKRKTHAKKRRTIKRRNPITAAANPIKRRRRRVRRNPISVPRRARRAGAATRGVVNQLLMPSLTAAAGALSLDVLWANLPIPASVKTGGMQYIAKAGGAVALVAIAHKLTKSRATAERMGIGALTVLMHDMGRGMIKRNLPGIRLGEYVGAGGGLDYDSPLDFYMTAPQGANTVQTYPPQIAQQPAPAMAGYDDGMGEYVGEYVGGYDDYDGLGDDDYLYAE